MRSAVERIGRVGGLGNCAMREKFPAGATIRTVRTKTLATAKFLGSAATTLSAKYGKCGEYGFRHASPYRSGKLGPSA